MHVCSPESQHHLGLHPENWVQQEILPRLCFCETWGAASSLGALTQDGFGPVWETSEDIHKDYQRAGALLLWRQTGRIAVVQPAEKHAPGRISSSFSIPKAVYKRAGEGLLTRACCKGNGFKLKKVRSSLDIKKKFFIVRVKRQWNTLPRNVVNSLEEFKVNFNEDFSCSILSKIDIL